MVSTPQKARYAVLLSGTPALSRPIELYTQLSCLDRHFSMNLFEFGKRYCAAVKVCSDIHNLYCHLVFVSTEYLGLGFLRSLPLEGAAAVHGGVCHDQVSI